MLVPWRVLSCNLNTQVFGSFFRIRRIRRFFPKKIGSGVVALDNWILSVPRDGMDGPWTDQGNCAKFAIRYTYIHIYIYAYIHIYIYTYTHHICSFQKVKSMVTSFDLLWQFVFCQATRTDCLMALQLQASTANHLGPTC